MMRMGMMCKSVYLAPEERRGKIDDGETMMTMMTMMITNKSPPCVRSSHLRMLQKLDVAEEFVIHRFAKPPQIENVTLI